jgi:hypothetical protein
MDIIKLVRTANTIARNCGSPRSLFFLGPQDSVQVQAFGIHPSLRMAVCGDERQASRNAQPGRSPDRHQP